MAVAARPRSCGAALGGARVKRVGCITLNRGSRQRKTRQAKPRQSKPQPRKVADTQIGRIGL